MLCLCLFLQSVYDFNCEKSTLRHETPLVTTYQTCFRSNKTNMVSIIKRFYFILVLWFVWWDILTSQVPLTYARHNFIAPFRSTDGEVVYTLDDFSGLGCITEDEAWRTGDISEQYVLFHPVGYCTIAPQLYVWTTWSHG